MPHLSIITVNYNNAAGLRRTIESVVKQTFSDFEYILIDGGSTDGSADIIKEFSDKITYWVSEPDKGIYNAMNKGIRKAEGKYLQFLNSGDWFLNDSVLQNFFSIKYDDDILYGDVNSAPENGVLTHYKVGKEEDITLAYLIKDVLPHQATFYKKSLFSTGLYDETYRIVADWKFNIERIVFDNCSIRKIDLIVINYDMSGISRQSEHFNLHQSERERVFSEVVPDRIARDYKKLVIFTDSPLLKHMPYLSEYKRFHILVSKLVGIAIKIFKLFRSV